MPGPRPGMTKFGGFAQFVNARHSGSRVGCRRARAGAARWLARNDTVVGDAPLRQVGFTRLVPVKTVGRDALTISARGGAGISFSQESRKWLVRR